MSRRLLPLALVALLGLSACRGAGTTLTVLAASSLSEAFAVIADDFEGAHPGVEVRISTAGSQQLATQVLEGAPADVFASADQVQMARVVDAGLASDPVVFARNELTIAAAPGAPRITSLSNLDDEGVRVVLAAPEVPAGRYARQLLDRFGIDVDPVSLEPNVRSVLAKVALGEADAGLVYRSDLVGTDTAATEIRIPSGMNTTAEYPVVALRDAPHPDLADAFVDHLQGAAAQARLWALGFALAEPPS